MKIAHVAPPFLPLDNAISLGGIEAVIVSLIKKQALFGHEIKVVATSDSTIDNLIPTTKGIGLEILYPKEISQDKVREITYSKLNHIAKAMEFALKNPDFFLHVHDDYMLPFLKLLPNPSLLTIHCPYEFFWQREQKEQFPLVENTQKKVLLIAVSKSHSRRFESEGFPIYQVVHNGVEVESFPFEKSKENYLLSLSAIAWHKGQKEAIEVAQALKQDLIIAGNIADQDYFDSFKKEINFDISSAEDKLEAYHQLPLQEKVVYAGFVNNQQKKPLFAKAKSLLMPVSADESFGVVVVEALACGTPVIAFNRGALPEIIINGKTGYIVETAEEMVKAAKNIKEMNPEDCRKHVEANFSLDKMAAEYLKLYQQIIEGKKYI